VLDAARSANIPVGHVVVQFRKGYPEIPQEDAAGEGAGEHQLFTNIRRGGILVEGSEGAS